MSTVKYSYYNQVQAERDIQGAQFTRGQINFKWENMGHSLFYPAKSYFRVRVKLTQAGTESPLLPQSGIAPNMYLVDNMFQQMRMRINGNVISSVDDYVPQISALKRRIQQAESRNDKLGKSLELSHSSFYDRLQVMIGGGIKTERQFHMHTEPPTELVAGLGEPIPHLRGAWYQVVASPAGTQPGTIIVTTANADGAVLPLANGLLLSDIFSVGETIRFLSGAPQQSGVILSINDTTSRMTIQAKTANGLDVATQVFARALHTHLHMRKIAKVPWGIQRDRQSSFIELIWQPMMGFWQIEDYICGKFHFELTPVVESSLKNYVIESIGAASADVDTFDFEVVSMLMYGYTGYSETARSGSKEYYTQECFMQAQNLTTASLTNKNFSVNPNTFALSLAIQQGGAGSDTRRSRTKFKLGNNEDLSLQRFYIQYKGVMLPRVIPDPLYQPVAFVDYTTQNYYEMLHYSGAFNKSVPEDILTWQERGPFYHYEWPNPQNPSTGVSVSTQFAFKNANAIRDYTPQVLLFHHYNNKFTVNMTNGQVTGIN